MNKAFSSWIYQIAVNCSKNYLNRNRKNDKLIEKEKYRLRQSKGISDSPEVEVISDFDVSEFNNAVNSLQEKFRDVFVLRYDNKLKYSEISNVLNCSERTAKWRMKKAVERITHHLKERNVI